MLFSGNYWQHTCDSWLLRLQRRTWDLHHHWSCCGCICAINHYRWELL